MTYEYSIIRFVPDAVRGEAVNLGAVAGSDETGDWELRSISNLVRARALDTTNSLPGALAFLSEIEDHIAAHDMLTPERQPLSSDLLSRWALEMRNIVQFTSPAPLVATSAADALDLVFDHVVVDPGRREFRFEKKHRAVSSTVAAYRGAGVPEEAILRKVAVRAEPFTDSFDLAVANGRLVQLVKCWSFQLPSQEQLAEEVKAWAWLVERIRERGGIATASTRTYDITNSEPDVSVVYVPPTDPDKAPAFAEAVAAFQTLRVDAVSADNAEAVAQKAAATFHHAPGVGYLWREGL